ncbi:DUF4386 domain-containing protein [bacterium]|nr:DUF4386 domain-containing protein [bacterium]
MPVSASPRALSRLAGVLYLVIIALGIFAEMGVRAKLFVEGDPAGTAARIAASPDLFRAGFAADAVMVVCDVAVAVLLYVLLKPAGPVLSMSAMFFRATQAAVLGLNLLHFHAARLILDGTAYRASLEPEQARALSYLFLDLHRHGYDLGLVFFGVHCVLLGVLIARSGFLPRALGLLVAAAGVVYLVGSGARFLFPEALGTVSALYVVAFVSESALCLWLLVKGIDPGTRPARPTAAP